MSAPQKRLSPAAAEPHLSPEDLAVREGVPLETVYGWNKTGDAPRRMRIGRHIRYRLADVIAWEESRVVSKSA
jgi:predicted DNA-binding transcriptional regulator AlpA